MESNVKIESEHSVIGRSPSWLVTSGSGLLLIIILLLILLSYLVKYPDTIKATIKVTTNRQPILVKSKSIGFLKFDSSVDGTYTLKDEVLGYLENETSIEIIDKIKILIEDSSNNNKSDLLENKINYNDFGKFSYDVLNYCQSLLRYWEHKKYSIDKEQLESLKQELPNRINLLREHKALINHEERNLEIATNVYFRDSLLHSTMVLSEYDFQKSEQNYLKTLSTMNSILKEKINIENSISSLQNQINELEKRININRLNTFQDLELNKRILLDKTEEWEYNQLIRSPIEGRIHIHKILETNQLIYPDDELFYILSDESESYAYTYINQAGFGKVKIGQQTLIKLDDFPYQEFGIVKGKVSSISSIYTSKGYLVKIELSDGLLTTFNERLRFSNEMAGTCEIVTDNTRLLQRIFYQLRNNDDPPIIRTDLARF